MNSEAMTDTSHTDTAEPVLPESQPIHEGGHGHADADDPLLAEHATWALARIARGGTRREGR